MNNFFKRELIVHKKKNPEVNKMDPVKWTR